MRGLTCEQVGDLAAENRITIHELFQEKASLEAAFMELTRDSVEYHAPTPGSGAEPQAIATSSPEVHQ